ncbi:MAG: ABC transporter ATP-binding protein [Burkholderiaceae bacterium]|nr:ABC transporter ATP-binding protein [Burkholderiaceae bacterium]
MGTITVSNLGKAYKQYPTRWSRLLEWLNPRHNPHHTLKWVLQDINFTVQAGEAVGIIGLNGTGKSTLLKMITGTTQPTTGSVHISGRVAALLELGIGFHPDFTGRQNVYMAGQLLGYSLDEILMLMPDIEAFAEIGDYIDQPVRVYSSGMQMRLAFSVATAQRPDVLIVDEALSVGDAYFVHKSFGRIKAFRESGTTLLLVSHDKGSIQSICDRAFLLHAGRVAMEGEPEAVMDYYNAILADKENQNVKQLTRANGKVQTVSGSGEVELDSVELLNAKFEPVDVINIGDMLNIRIRYTPQEVIPNLTVGFMVKDRLGQPVFGTNTHHLKHAIECYPARQRSQCVFTFPANIGVGSYSVAIALHSGETHVVKNYEWRDLAAVFNVVNLNKPDSVGTSWLPVKVLSEAA